MATVPTRHYYKIYRNGAFLGLLPNVTSDFGYSQSLNTAAASLTITVGTTADVSSQAVEAIQTESGADLQTESGETLTTERAKDVIGNVDGTLIRNNNDIRVYEVSASNPNGKLVFSGYISRWAARFGQDDDIEITCLNYGTELDNYIIQGSSTLDQTNIQGTNTFLIYEQIGGMVTAWQRAGQVWTVGANVDNLSGILVKLALVNSGEAYTVSVKVWNSAADFFTDAPLAIATQYITSTTPTEYTFIPTTSLPVSEGQSYFYSVQASNGTAYSGGGVNIYYDNADSYVGGNMWTSSFGGGGGGSWGEVGPANDLYFRTFFTGGSTNSPFNSTDPGQIVVDILNSYRSRGGNVGYTALSIWATTTLASYTFQVNTILEGIKKCLDLAPANWFWFVDPADNTLYFRETAYAAEHTFTLHRHINVLSLLATIEDVRTQVYFTGGSTGSTNLYVQRYDSGALAANNGRVGLERFVDNRVTLEDTAITIADSFLNENSAESYQSTITIDANTYDISTIALGQTIGFAGFGTFVDNLLLQVVTVDRTPDSITLTLGKLPSRQSAQVEAIERQLREVQTIDNPAVPS